MNGRRTAISNVRMSTKDQDRSIGMNGTNGVIDERPCQKNFIHFFNIKNNEVLQLSRETGICLKKKVQNCTAETS